MWVSGLRGSGSLVGRISIQFKTRVQTGSSCLPPDETGLFDKGPFERKQGSRGHLTSKLVKLRIKLKSFATKLVAGGGAKEVANSTGLVGQK